MYRTYLKVALRNLIKRKNHSVLNIIGLAIGISACLLIFQYVAYEKTYDDFSPKADRIARLTLASYHTGELVSQSATVYPAFGPEMKKDFPEIKDYCRLAPAGLLLSNDERNIKFKEDNGYYAQASFISMFNINILRGDPKSMLSGLDQIVLSANMAKKYFGDENPIGKTLVYRSAFFTRTFQVSGVINPPIHSHLTINYLISYSTLGSFRRQFGDMSRPEETSWGWPIVYTYLLLKPGTDLKKLEGKFPAFCDQHINNIDWKKANNIRNEVQLMPLKDIHLHSHYSQEAERNGNAQTVSFLFLLALLIIGIAWVNFINLSTARSLERAKEVGVRKLIGANRFMLIKQFFIESILINLISFLLALLITVSITPVFSNIIADNLPKTFFLPLSYWLLIIVIFIAGTFLSGIYPALILSGFRPVAVLKGVFRNSAQGLILRKSLIILQFAITVILIAGTIIIFKQLKYMRSQPLGVNINQTLILNGAGSLKDSAYQRVYDPFKHDILQLPAVKSITASSSTMGNENTWSNNVSRSGLVSASPVALDFLGVDYDFIPAYEVKLLAGRNFSKGFSSDSNAAILNETAVKMLGFNSPEQAINKKLGNENGRKIIGVVKDYHTEALNKSIDPQMMILWSNVRGVYSVKITSNNISATINAIREKWLNYFPNDPFNYYFLDEAFDSQYKADKQFETVFGIFTLIAIAIACMGLLGLSSYNVFQRTKEIGVRKVLGASVSSITMLLSKNFIGLILMAFAIASPVAWYIMHNWLRNFAYRINVSWWILPLAGGIAVFVAFITISFQAIKAAIANPIKSLRTE